MSENNITRIFKEKPETLFKDKYGGSSFTVKELNEGFLKPTMVLSKDPNSPEMKELQEFFERYEKS